MCGIIAAFNTTIEIGKEKNKYKIKTEDVNEFIINQYQDQSARGQKGFGIINIDSKGNTMIHRACESTKFLLDLYMKPSKMIIAHHRMPTSTENKIAQTHPIVVTNNLLEHTYLIIHNGIITNDNELYKKHTELGFIYQTQYIEKNYYQHQPEIKWNDSECLAIELALFIENKTNTIELDNSAAFMAIQLNKKTNIAETIFFGKNGISSSLNMSKTRGKLRISSEGEGTEITEKILYSFNIKDPTMNLKKKTLKFKEKEIITEKEHSNWCSCADCAQNKRGYHKENSTLHLPVKQEIKNNIENKAETPTIRPKRAWNSIEYSSDEDDPTPIIGKGYITETARDFKEHIKNTTTTDITHIIDDALDEEMDKITEIILEYKNILIKDHLEKEEETFFIEQIEQIIKTMKVLTDIADSKYKEKELLEQQEEMEKEYPDKDYSKLPRHSNHKRFGENINIMGFNRKEENDETVGRSIHYLG